MTNLNDNVGFWDSVLIENLTEETFISNIYQRYKRGLIYVSKTTSDYSKFLYKILRIHIMLTLELGSILNSEPTHNFLGCYTTQMTTDEF